MRHQSRLAKKVKQMWRQIGYEQEPPTLTPHAVESC